MVFSLKTNPSLTKKTSKISQNYEKIRICLQEFLEDTHRQSFLPIKFDARTEACSGDNYYIGHSKTVIFEQHYFRNFTS
jgi:hypothetical protein